MSFKIYAELHPRRKTFAAGVHVCSSLAAARRAGHPLIDHPREKTYEEVAMEGTLTESTMVRGVSVRNHTDEELTLIRQVLERVPGALLVRFAAEYSGIVCVDWSGSPWPVGSRPNLTTLLSGGANMADARTRGDVTESGMRIELTHSAMYETRPSGGRRGTFTLWHELGHVAYRYGFTPRTVERDDYGESIHVGREEQPAYAFMWYYLRPGRLTSRDRAAFARLLDGADTDSPSASEPPPMHPSARRLHTRRIVDGVNANGSWRRPGPSCISLGDSIREEDSHLDLRHQYPL